MTDPLALPDPPSADGRARMPAGRFGPTLTGGSGAGPKPSRVVLASVVVVVGLALVAAGAAASLLVYGQASVSQVEVDGRQDPGTVADERGAGSSGPGGDGGASAAGIEEAEGVVNVLAIGSDSREGLTEDQLRRLGTERADGMRTDSIMLVQLDLDRDEASLLSFPRDLLVTRCDGSRGRINAAYAVGERDGRGGPTCLVQTVTELTGIPVQHYVEVDFAGFIDVVDALGGVSIWLDEPLEDAHAGVDLEAGCVDMDGPTALGYVRSRRADGDGDFGRIQRQQRFLQTVLDDAVSVGTLMNPSRLFGLVGSAARAVETDEDLGLGEMRRLAYSMRGIDVNGLDVYTVPGHNRQIDGAWMVVADEDEAEELYAAFRHGEAVPEGVGVDEPGDVTPADVPPVRVRDGSDRPGLAWSVASALEREGFEVDDTGEADVDDADRTEVRAPEGRREEARLLADALGGAEIVVGDDEEGVTAILGADFDEGALDEGDGARDDDDAAAPDVDATPTPDPGDDDGARRRC